MKRLTKALSMFLAIIMVVGLLPLSIIAEDIQNTHTVQFKLNYNGAHKIPSQKVADGECAVQPEDVTREGWIFEYWYVKTGDGIQKFDLSQPITEDVTLYARWDEDITYWGPIWGRNIAGAIERAEEEAEPNTYTVTFDGNGVNVENIPAAQTVNEGECAVEPSAPTRNGYTFGGWCTDAALTVAYDFTAVVTADITLYAKWTVNAPEGTYVVTFETNGGSEINEQIIYAGDCAIRPAAPVKENYVFENWYADSELTTLYDFTAPVEQNITLYAKWTALDVVITINPGDYAENIVNRTITGTVAANIAITEITYTQVSANKNISDTVILDSTGAFAVDVLLEDGETVFTVTVVTADGSSTSESVTLTYDSGYVYDDEVYDETDDRLIRLPIWYSDDTSGDPDEYLVSNILSLYFYDYVTFEERMAFITDVIGGEVAGYLNSLDMMQVLLPNPLTNAEDVGYEGETDLTAITEDELYEYADALVMTYSDVLDIVELEYVHVGLSVAITTNDPWNGNADDDWWLEAIDAYDAWEYDNFYNSDYLHNVTVGVVDDGFDTDHEELNGRINVVSSSDTVNNHGTHVSGIIAADANNSRGLAGVLYDNVTRIVAYDADPGNTNSMSDSQIRSGLTRAVEGGAKVINFSLGQSGGIAADTYEKSASSIRQNGKNYSTTMGKLLSKDNTDFIVVQAAGNGNSDGLGVNYWNNGLFASINNENCYSTNGGLFSNAVSKSDIMDRVIIVANLQENNVLNSSSNGGSGELNIIAAPGTSIYSSVNGTSSYDYYTGTSMAAPIVTAVCAMTWSVNSKLSGASVVDLVMDNTVGTAVTNTTRYMIAERNSDGNVVRDENGNIVYRTDENGNIRPYTSQTTGGMGIVNALESVEAAIETLPTYWGTIVDAVTGDPIQAKVVIYNNGTLIGDIVGSEQEYYSLENGTLDLPKLPAGIYTLLISAEGYTSRPYVYIASESATPGERKNLGTIPMSPLMDEDDYRIILRWTGEPRDLDSHLVATTADSGNYHVAYYDQNPSPAYANLDRDDTDYEGPETITITEFGSLRKIRYAVHDYTNRSATYSTVMSYSGAWVEVYKGTAAEPIATFNVPTGTNGTEWDVFAIDAVGNIIPVNEMTYCENPSNVLAGSSAASAASVATFSRRSVNPMLKDYELE